MQQYQIQLKGREYTIVRHADGTFELPPELTQTKGLGSGLKPAWEPILVFRKPLKGTLASNVLEHGTGALNIDATRVRHASKEDFEAHKKGVDAIREKGGSRDKSWKNSSDLSGANEVTASGRWPSNCLLEHSPLCTKIGTKKIKGSHAVVAKGESFEGRTLLSENKHVFGAYSKEKPLMSHVGLDGLEETEAWQCVEGCPVKALDAQSGERPSTLTGRADPNDSHKHPGTVMKPNSAFLGERSHLSKVYADNGGAARFFTQLGPDEDASSGRWPANILLEHSPGCERAGLKKVKGITGGTKPPVRKGDVYSETGGLYTPGREQPAVSGYSGEDGTETVESWNCVEGCPVKTLQEQGVESGSHAAGNKTVANQSVSNRRVYGTFEPFKHNPDYHADEGGVDRFFSQFEAEGSVPFRYVPKANRKEAGCGEFEVEHITVKPLELMRWLVKLVTPKGGIVLDPYAGSGSTCHAAVLEGMHYVGMERHEPSHAEATRRMGIVHSRERERQESEAIFDFAMGGSDNAEDELHETL